ncbi:unnamed protein product [Calypogeia fissa]
MAALTAASCSTTAVVGLSGSSLSGKKLAIKSARPVPIKAARSVGITAKYDVEKSLYFDLTDIENTTGNWDMYGSDSLSPYNGLQSKFFETVVAAFTKRGLLLKFLILGGAGALGYASTTATGDLLAIKNGPKSSPEMGPRGRI